MIEYLPFHHYLLMFIACIIACVVVGRAYFIKGKYTPAMERNRDFNTEIECDRFRKLLIKLYELNIIQENEHFTADTTTVNFNIRDLYPIYKVHYPMYFPEDKVPDYEMLLEIIAFDKGYSGTTNLWFEKAAYRPAVCIKRFVNEFIQTQPAK